MLITMEGLRYKARTYTLLRRTLSTHAHTHKHTHKHAHTYTHNTSARNKRHGMRCACMQNKSTYSWNASWSFVGTGKVAAAGHCAAGSLFGLHVCGFGLVWGLMTSSYWKQCTLASNKWKKVATKVEAMLMSFFMGDGRISVLSRAHS